MARHRGLRKRYDRMVAGLAALGITLFAVINGLSAGSVASPVAAPTKPTTSTPTVHMDPQGSADAIAVAGAEAKATKRSTPSPTPTPTTSVATDALPADSGTGQRVVFSISDQRVWLVDADDAVDRSYLVSGSVTNNLKPGTYAVYSRSRWAVGVDDSGVMEYFVRFTRGANAAIGFHTIPTQNGVPLQTLQQLGTPRSHGCIRQATPDAIALWDFAPIGRTVVVVA